MNLIQVKNLCKTYDNEGVKTNAVCGVSFAVSKGEFVSIMGPSGSGKSTLMKILFGVYKPDKGHINIYSNKVKFNSPLDAIKHNIGMLYQHFMLIDDFTVLENVILGNEVTKNFKLDIEKITSILKTYIDKYNLNLNLSDKIQNLSISQQQKVEILKLLFI